MSNKPGSVDSEEVISIVNGKLESLVNEIIGADKLSAFSESFDPENIKGSVTLILMRIAAARQLSHVQREQLLHNPVIKQKLFELIKAAVGEEKEKRKHAHQRIEEWQSAIAQQTQEELQQEAAHYKQQKTEKDKDAELQQQKKRAEELAKSLTEKEQRLVSAKAQLKILYQQYDASVQEFVAVLNEGVTVLEQVGLGLTHITSDTVADLILNPTELLEQLRLLGAIEMARTIEQSADDSVNKKLQAVVLLDRSKSLSPAEEPTSLQTLIEDIKAEFDALVDAARRPDAVAKDFRTFLQAAQKLEAEVGEKLRKVEQQLEEVQKIKVELNDVESGIDAEADEFLDRYGYAAPEINDAAEESSASLANMLFKSQSSIFAQNGKTSPLPEPSAPPAPREDEATQEEQQEKRNPRGPAGTGNTDE